MAAAYYVIIQSADHLIFGASGNNEQFVVAYQWSQRISWQKHFLPCFRHCSWTLVKLKLKVSWLFWDLSSPLWLPIQTVPVCKKNMTTKEKQQFVGKGIRFLTHYLQGTTKLLKLHFIQCTVKSVYILSSLKINKYIKELTRMSMNISVLPFSEYLCVVKTSSCIKWVVKTHISAVL